MSNQQQKKPHSILKKSVHFDTRDYNDDDTLSSSSSAAEEEDDVDENEDDDDEENQDDTTTTDSEDDEEEDDSIKPQKKQKIKKKKTTTPTVKAKNNNHKETKAFKALGTSSTLLSDLLLLEKKGPKALQTIDTMSLKTEQESEAGLETTAAVETRIWVQIGTIARLLTGLKRFKLNAQLRHHLEDFDVRRLLHLIESWPKLQQLRLILTKTTTTAASSPKKSQDANLLQLLETNLLFKGLLSRSSQLRVLQLQIAWPLTKLSGSGGVDNSDEDVVLFSGHYPTLEILQLSIADPPPPQQQQNSRPVPLLLKLSVPSLQCLDLALPLDSNSTLSNLTHLKALRFRHRGLSAYNTLLPVLRLCRNLEELRFHFDEPDTDTTSWDFDGLFQLPALSRIYWLGHAYNPAFWTRVIGGGTLESPFILKRSLQWHVSSELVKPYSSSNGDTNLVSAVIRGVVQETFDHCQFKEGGGARRRPFHLQVKIVGVLDDGLDAGASPLSSSSSKSDRGDDEDNCEEYFEQTQEADEEEEEEEKEYRRVVYFKNLWLTDVLQSAQNTDFLTVQTETKIHEAPFLCK